MGTTADSIKRAHELEDTANILRNKIARLNYEKTILIRGHKSTAQIDEEIKKYVDDLAIINNAYKVARDELGDSYYRIGVDKDD